MKYIWSRTASFGCLLMSLMLVYSCTAPTASLRQQINLSGEWQFALDTTNTGDQEGWFSQELNDHITLPGTTDENQKGFQPKDTTTLHLARRWSYEGAAWYRKTVEIPQDWSGKIITLVMERTRSTKVWVDDQLAGSSQLLQSAQQYALSDLLSPGKHTITICVNNDLKLTPYGNVHIYSNDTQTNWNGILGSFYLEAKEQTSIADLQVFPDVAANQARVRLALNLGAGETDLQVILHVKHLKTGKSLPEMTFPIGIQDSPELIYTFPEAADLWDEFDQPLYELTAVLRSEKALDEQRVTFGIREFAVKEKQFTINGRKTFLRGKHEAAVFPLSGHPPMDVAGWERVFLIAKSYGINHYRFHTYCPPEAAFAAADQVGIYLQAELPFWGGLDADSIADLLEVEGRNMLLAYGNHPSFVMFSPGNEIWGGHERVERVMTTLKMADDRPLYTMGSNNNIGYLPPKEYAEFFVGARVPERGDTTIGQARLTHAFADAWHGGYLNIFTPNTQVNFQFATDQLQIPLVSHEIGQYQIYPEYNEIQKYTGVLRADNLSVFQQRLTTAGMAEMDSAFQNASGAWSALCFKAEMEAALRTPQMAGFQLLDLQDFPGQGTALVGVLDAFMDSKGVVTPNKWRQSCDEVVILAEFEKFCWTNDETFISSIQVANYSNHAINQPLKWTVTKKDGTTFAQGQLENESWANEGLSSTFPISFSLKGFNDAKQLNFHLEFADQSFSNDYDLWVYPADHEVEIPDDILIRRSLDQKTLQALEKGGKVLLFPGSELVKDHSLPGLFPPDFWNYGMFKMISGWNKKEVSPGTLGLLMDPNHPALQNFPTDYHTNYQWFHLIKNSRSLMLTETPQDYKPIIQVIDNLERNLKLGMICEFQVGEGKLLICMSPLDQLSDYPEARQLYRSLLGYMKSDDFQPETQLPEEMRNWFKPE